MTSVFVFHTIILYDSKSDFFYLLDYLWFVFFLPIYNGASAPGDCQISCATEDCLVRPLGPNANGIPNSHSERPRVKGVKNDQVSCYVIRG